MPYIRFNLRLDDGFYLTPTEPVLRDKLAEMRNIESVIGDQGFNQYNQHRMVVDNLIEQHAKKIIQGKL